MLENLRLNAERALQQRPVLDKDGKETGEYKYDGAVANRALELIGKEPPHSVSFGSCQDLFAARLGS